MKFTEDELKSVVKLRNLEERRVKIAQQRAELERKEALLNAALLGRNRKRDTTRKILLGSFILKMMNGDENERCKILRGLDAYLVKEHDRVLFPELKEEGFDLV